jgi:hypothetical protein
MTPNETIQIMQRCSEEIKSLRKTISVLAPKAEAYDAICCILGLLPRQSQGMGEDLVWRLEKEIKKELDDLNSQKDLI